MKFRYLLVLSLLPQWGFAEQFPEKNVADDATSSVTLTQGQCVILPPMVPRSESSEQLGIVDNHIRIESDRSEAEMGKRAHFSGGVTFNQAGRHIYADEATVDNETQQVSAKGDLTFDDPTVTITADSINAEMKNNSAILRGSQYWLKGKQIHGAASLLEITSENNLILNNSSFTTCPPEQQSWVLEADKIEIDRNEEWGEIWDAKLKIADVPVFYIPYMTIPVSDKRKSGLLFPKFSTSTTNGVQVATPIYWNIAPEYDLTFTPDYMSSRGLLSKVEFRYLTGKAQNGQFNVEYLPTDDAIKGSPNRYLYHWRHQGMIDDNWRVQANFTDVSDNNYFTDLDSDIRQNNDNQLIRVGELNYLERNWDIGIKVQDIKVLGLSEKPYQVLPQLTWNYRAPDYFSNFDFSLYSEVTNFAHQDNEQNTATRLHVEPSLIFPFYGPAGAFTAEMKLYQTSYWQKSERQNSVLDKQVNRTIPSIRLHGQVNFERDVELFSSHYRQTLEPQAQYLYIGYQDQSHIGLYDTAQLQEDYFGLFRDRRFSGLDRIADANQFTLGMTSRFFDEHNREQFKFSFGQIFYLQDSRVALSNVKNTTQPSASVLASELDAHLYDDWFFSSELQYDTKNSKTKKGEFALDFRPEANKLFQMSYRFVPDLLDTNTNSTAKISQAGARMAWPVKDDLYFVGNWYYDIKQKRNVEAYAGFQYESCCWAVRLSYHYRIKTNFDDNVVPNPVLRDKYERGFSLDFQIKGLGGFGNLGVTDMLSEGIFNYRKPLYLRN
ncbi:MAG: LPS assembly protein LptD [Parashewanella sp.]